MFTAVLFKEFNFVNIWNVQELGVAIKNVARLLLINAVITNCYS